jgi:hypothetical protein
MTTQKREITRDDILPLKTYAAERKALRQDIRAVKNRRRIEVGPFATFYFENYQTMWHQVHEMLYAEKGGDAQVADELTAYNPLIPKGRELVATIMFEIDDEARRAVALRRLGGIEHKMFITIGGEKIRAVPEADVERTKEDGKTSSVHFARFPFTPAQIAAFRKPDAEIILGFDHPEYGHMAMLAETNRQALAEDFE